MILRPDSYFIPFSDIIGIGYMSYKNDTPFNYWFLMRDGSLAYCNMFFSGEEGQKLLAEQLRGRCPVVGAFVRIKIPESDFPGVSPREMARSVLGKDAPIRYFTPR